NEKLSLLQCDDAYLERYLYSTEFDVNLAFKKDKSILRKSLEEKPEWFTTESPLDKEDMIKRDIRILTSNYDKEGHPVYIVPIPHHTQCVVLCDLLKDVVVVDYFFMELMLANDSNAKNGLGCIQCLSKNTNSTLLKSSVVINAAIILYGHSYHKILKMGVSSKFLSLYYYSVKFHFNDFDSLHEYVGPDVLPPEYGGTSKIDYKPSQQRVLDQSKQIAETFRINRELYLQQIEH
ncbi:hypothetical protein NQ317_004436, partial [Molorchus minor]